mgnify:FL=1
MEAEQVLSKIEKAFARFNTKDGVSPGDARIMIYIGESEESPVRFDLFNVDKFVRLVDMQKDVLDIMFDPFDKAKLVNVFLLNSLVKIAKKNNCEPYECYIIITKDEAQNRIVVRFGNKEHRLHEITFDEIFSQEALIG